MHDVPDDADDPPDDDPVYEAERALYSAAPEDFLALRTELAGRSRTAGRGAAAKRIAALRKPTAAAALVNRLAWDDPSAVDRLLDLGTRLRAAHAELDAALMRELSLERRSTVAELGRAALELDAGRRPSGSVRDEVTATLDAAVADPDIAARLGRLQRAEHWSGFGMVATGAPELTLVRGGKDAPRPRPGSRTPRRSDPSATEPTAEPTTPAIPAATRRKQERALSKAQDAFATAAAALEEAEVAEQSGGEQVRQLAAELADVQRQLDAAKRELDQARRAVRSARSRRREARSALDRAERQSAD